MGDGSLKWKLLQSLFWLLKITCNLQQLSASLMEFCNLVLVCSSDIVPKLGRTNHRGFFSTVGTLRIWSLNKSNLKQLSLNFLDSHFFWNISLKSINCWWNIGQLEHIWKHLLMYQSYQFCKYQVESYQNGCIHHWKLVFDRHLLQIYPVHE